MLKCRILLISDQRASASIFDETIVNDHALQSHITNHLKPEKKKWENVDIFE